MEELTIHFAPVVSRPEKIICVGLNYDEHNNEVGFQNDSKTGFPPVFSEFNSALIGHKENLHLHKKAKKFDYESELVIIIGKEVSKEDAEKCIAGYTVENDFSARDMQLVSSRWTMGKACDDFAPIGPYFVSKSEVNVDNFTISCKVNGEYISVLSKISMFKSRQYLMIAMYDIPKLECNQLAG